LKVEKTALPGLLRLEPRVFADARGFFMETWSARLFAELGIAAGFVQDNQSHSVKNVLRGLHYQIRQPQGKLVRCIAGAIWDVAVDLRRGSKTFGRWAGMRLDADAHAMAWIPAGFAHGFLVLSDEAEVLYKATDAYAPRHERTLLWNDPALAIAWPLPGNPPGEPLLSDKDRRGVPLAQADTYD
jgi:dTDP-4-dehydrorhamnose 3,5-epimerase